MRGCVCTTCDAVCRAETSEQAEDQTPELLLPDRGGVDAESTVTSEESTVVRDRVKASGWRFVLADVHYRMTGIPESCVCSIPSIR